MASEESATQTADESERSGVLIEVSVGNITDDRLVHHSVAFDGYEHETACGLSLDADKAENVEMDIPDDLDSVVGICSGCTPDEEIVWEFQCAECGTEKEVPESETDFSPTSLAGPKCPECDDEWMRHVGPILDECDRCGQELLYEGCDGPGDETLCERHYEQLMETF